MGNGSELKKIGICEYGVISTKELVFDQEIRRICEGNTCRLYGKSWACPPAVGTVEECRERCLQYPNAMIFNGVYPLEDSFDYEGMVRGHGAFKALCDRLYAWAAPQWSSFLLLSNEGCGRCESCTYPSAGCRMPQLLFPSVEGFAIQVCQSAAKANVPYVHGKNTVTYFGVLLY